MNKKSVVDELVTIKDFIRWGYCQLNQADVYYGHGTDNAMDEIFMLVMASLHLQPEEADKFLDCRLTADEKETLAQRLDKRISLRIPTAYLTHEAWFAGLPFYVDERVLIPRSPLAELIDAQFTPWIDPEQVHRILDLCTGSACIAIACAYAFPGVQVDAADISDDALDVAKTNIGRHALGEQVEAIQSDLMDDLAGRHYDIIVCNPPYVSAEEMQTLPQEYLYEPKIALQSGQDGLNIVKQILRDAGAHLSPNGILIVEVGNSQPALINAFPDMPFLWLEFSRGGDGVLLLTAEQLQSYQFI